MAELIRETVCVGERSIPVFSQAYCEADIIVPDVNPDIAKILQINANGILTNKSCGSNRIVADGKADILILYMGDDGGIYSINASQPFSHMIDSNGTTEGMNTELELDVENVEYTITNSRKLNVKVLIGIDANASTDLYADLCTGIVTDEPYEIRMKTIHPFKTAARTTEQICVKERLELPAGKPSAERILRMDTALRDKSCKPVSDKLIVKGTLGITTVYLCDMDGNVHLAEHEVPFTEVLEMPGITEDMTPTCRICVDKTYCKPEQDEDGDNRYIDMECMMTVCAKVCSGYSMDIVEDAYSTKHPVHITRESVKVSRLTADTRNQLSVKDIVTLPADMPEITQVYNVIAKPYIGTTNIENGRIVIDGVIEADILYLSSDSKSPLNTYRHRQQFSHSIDMQGLSDDMMCDLTVDMEHVSYNISMGREMELRFVLGLDVKVLADDEITYMTALEPDETAEDAPAKSYCIKIYFARKGDDLWDIAKRYRITREALMEMNNLTEDSDMFDGKQILIPIK